MAKNFAKLPSEILAIEDATAALDFDRACSLRYQIFHNERESEKFKMLAMILGAEIKDAPNDPASDSIEEW
jgi:hypothetical protein